MENPNEIVGHKTFMDGRHEPETEGFETLDFEAPDLEAALSGGGWAEDGYDVRDLSGVEVLPSRENSDA